MDFDFGEFKKATEKFNEDKSSRDSLKSQIRNLGIEKKNLEERQLDAEEVRQIIQIVSKRTLANLEFRISNLVTFALASVFNPAPEFVASIETRRNQTEVDMLFKEGDRLQPPLDSDGGGAVDISAFALRPTFWTLDKTRPVFLLDEPFRNVSPNLQHKVSQMIEKISEELQVQIIMVSHAENINIAADKTFLVKKVDGISIVEEEK
jgi:DNA repair exonuclease SbcCD ATPase subunit